MPELQIYDHTSFPSDLNWQAVSFLRIEWPWVEGGLPRHTQAAEMNPTHFALIEKGFLLSYAAVISTQLIIQSEISEALSRSSSQSL